MACSLSTVYNLLGASDRRSVGCRSKLQLSLANREEIRVGLERGDSTFKATATASGTAKKPAYPTSPSRRCP